ncbi:hypothetical protein FBU30_001348 [Linnemannia zychae]|nr:hypothetical protein FBU30_001348 [Linnemannia zychae]
MQKADHSHHRHADHSDELNANAIPSKPYKGRIHDHHDHNEDHMSENVDEQPRHDISHDDSGKNLGDHGPDPENPTITSPTAPRKDKMVVAYWTDWTSASLGPEAIPFDKVTHVNYAFSIVGPDYRPVFQTDYLLNRVVWSAHQKDVKVLMSIGGWTGSQYFSPLAASSHGRRVFIDGAIDLIKMYSLDGIDIDWEYPGRMGSVCNIFDPQNDAKNFLRLLRELRMAMNQLPNGERLEISLATRVVPFDGSEGQMRDVSEFAKVVNHINVMAYDINGSWGTVTGANAPLTGDSELTYTNGAQAWIDAGFPSAQINMGVPFYGRSLTTKRDMSNQQSMQAPFMKQIPIGDNNDELWTDPCEKEASFSGVWKYKNLREQGLIDRNGNARTPWIRKFDQDSQTPWLFNPQTKQFISYDDKESIRLKVEYAKKKHLGGMMLWAINQDTTDFELLEVLQGIRRLYSSAANSEAVSTTSSTSVHNAAATTPLYTFQDLSEQQVLFAEMRYHNVSWTTIGEYFGISSVEAFFGYIPIATKAHKHQWISRMTEQDMVEHLSSKRS